MNLRRLLTLLMAVWTLSATSAHAGWFECSTFSLSFTPATVLQSDGNGGGTFVSRLTPQAGVNIYTGNLVARAKCNTSDSGTWRRGSLTLGFGAVGRTFAGGGLALMPVGRPTHVIEDRTYCGEDHGADNRTNSANPNYGTYWGNTEYVIALASNRWVGCWITITAPVRVTSGGGNVVAGASLAIPVSASSWDLGFIAGKTVSIAGTPANCAVTPSATTLAMPNVSAQQLNQAGATAGTQPFSITLTGCALLNSPYIASATWLFTPGLGASTIGNTAASPAGNVEFQMLDDTGTPIASGATTNLATGITSGTYTKNFTARYYARGPATAGAVRGVVTFALSYQ